MNFYDFEVFKYDWLVVIKNIFDKSVTKIVNNPEELEDYYQNHKDEIWLGYNSRGYDRYILKGILCGFNPYEINESIIDKGRAGFQFSPLLNQYPLINYDVMQGIGCGLKVCEGFMGHNIHESSVDFKIDRKLTDAEIQETLRYCENDVDETITVFIQNRSQFDSMLTLVKQFNLPIDCIGMTEARITAKILNCQPVKRNDEFDFIIEDYQELKKYTKVMDFFKSMQGNEYFYGSSLEIDIAGVPHKLGVGGIHGAIEKYMHHYDGKKQLWHVDVTSYYPSYLIAHDRITRNAQNPEKYAWCYFHQIDLKKQGKKKERAPYKKVLNALSGAMKDRYCTAYDPCMNNTMVVNCQISAVMLIEMLEEIEGFELIQSNTDGLIIAIPDTDEAFEQLDDICYQWEERCSTDKAWIGLEFDEIDWIYQKDVNNYIFRTTTGKIERKGAYLKELSSLDNDLPILNKALVDFFVEGTPVEKTINECNDSMMFQQIKKISSKYECMLHGGHYEKNQILNLKTGRLKTITEFKGDSVKVKERCVRVYASKDNSDGGLWKVHKTTKTKAKVEGTPEHCFIENGDVRGVKCPDRLDKQWYIDTTNERLKGFI